MDIQGSLRDIPMIRSFINKLLPALAVLAGCNTVGEAPMPPPDRVVVNFIGEVTRGTLDGTVESLDLLAFRTHDGTLDAVGRSDGGSGISVSLSCGTALTFYILANCPEGSLEGISCLQDFLASETLLDEAAGDTPQMYDCSTTEGLNALDNGSSILFHLKRYVAKVSLGSISVPWLDEFEPQPECLIGRIALVNAKGSSGRNGDSPHNGDLWYNRSGLDAPAGVSALLIRNAGTEVHGSAPVTCSTTLYAMPNHSDSEEYYGSVAWTPRRSRLAIELIVDGVPQWYPVTLPHLDGNCHYTIQNVSITGPGASHPDEEIVRNSIDFTISLTPWTETQEMIYFNNN